MAKKLSRTQIYRPTITLWNRLEGLPRTENFDRALKAEVRDALWMISKQWQMGEFIGDDAGSPILAKVHTETTQLTKYKPVNGPTDKFENDIPLEVKVENQKFAFESGENHISLDIRLLMGRQWLKLVSGIDSSLKNIFINASQYQIAKPDPLVKDDAYICAHPKSWQQHAAASQRCIDGYLVYQHITANPANHAYDGIVAITDSIQKGKIDIAASTFITWFENLFYQPLKKENPSWRPEYLEHQFSCSAPKGTNENILIADEYYNGSLDWYNFDYDQSKKTLGEASPVDDAESSLTYSFIPTSVTFGGMPNPRWWTFENNRTNLGFIKPDTTDLNKLLLLDFMLVYSNDWFLVPFTLPVGSLTNVKGLMVTNVFGEKTWVKPAGAGDDEDWQRWNMYTHNIKGTENKPADMGLTVLPVARKVLESKPIEEIYMLRDEIANMVWGVESIVPLANGKSKPGKEAGNELRAKLQQLLDSAGSTEEDITYKAKIRYLIANTVPEQWIPFIPVHRPGEIRETELQRAALPRVLVNDPEKPKKVEPRTSLLRHGLDDDTPTSYFIHEEEIPRAGINIKKSYQRTRWYNGKVFNWIGIRKKTGKGEGHSGLAYDQILPVKSFEEPS